eukprot:scaffold3960_cov19-Tisochrysis_lutea.AAC.2
MVPGAVAFSDGSEDACRCGALSDAVDSFKLLLYTKRSIMTFASASLSFPYLQMRAGESAVS